MKRNTENLRELINAINQSNIEPSVKEEIIKKIESGGKDDWNQAVILLIEAINVTCAVWNSFLQ